MEAEYVTLAVAVKEAKWLTMMSEELGLKERLKMPVVMLCDSQAAIKFASNRIEKTRTRHIDIAHHVARDAVQSGTVSIAYVPSNQNVADTLTKGLRPAAQKNALTLFNVKSQEIGGIEGISGHFTLIPPACTPFTVYTTCLPLSRLSCSLSPLCAIVKNACSV
ncbi:hypothetical protein D918_07018 [Trichuris suis]|nr:hypothetical protein D918_07018 [Trichuris suis]